ncbi:MAG: hypothetical protein H6719_10600 [Sandaracinaceae bacterium]|nr:hypothetical protein [Sandaracinaceae bacterium]
MVTAARSAVIQDGRVLVVGALRAPTVAPVDPHPVEAPATLGELRGALAAPRGEPFDAALIAGWGRDVDLVGLVSEVRRAVRSGGTVAFVVPIPRDGWRGARSAVLAMLRRQRPVPLEELCGALLMGKLVDVRVRPIEGAGGYAIVSAEVPPPWPDDVESSTIRRSVT